MMELHYYCVSDGHISSTLVIIPDEKADEVKEQWDDFDTDPDHFYFTKKVNNSDVSDSA